MTLKLAIPTFVSGPTDTFAALDYYTKSDSGVVNSIPDINDLFSSTALNVLKGGNLLGLDKITSLISSANPLNGLLKVNPQSLISGVLSSNAGLVGSLRSLPDTLQNKVLSSIGNTNIQATIGGITSLVTKADLSTVTGLGSMIGSLSGANLPMSFVDKSGLANLSTNLIREASSFGIPNAFTSFSTTMTDLPLLGSITKNLLPSLVSSSNINLLGEIASSPVAKNVIKQTPSFVQDFLKNYTNPIRPSSNQSLINYSSIDSSMNSIVPNWKNTQRGSSSTYNGNIISGSSDDFKQSVLNRARSSFSPINFSNVSNINTALNTPAEKYLSLVIPSNIQKQAKVITSNSFNMDFLKNSARQQIDKIFSQADLSLNF